MGEINDILNSRTHFIRVLWCDNANIIRAKAIHVNSIDDNNIAIGISRAQQGCPCYL